MLTPDALVPASPRQARGPCTPHAASTPASPARPAVTVAVSQGPLGKPPVSNALHLLVPRSRSLTRAPRTQTSCDGGSLGHPPAPRSQRPRRRSFPLEVGPCPQGPRERQAARCSRTIGAFPCFVQWGLGSPLCSVRSPFVLTPRLLRSPHLATSGWAGHWALGGCSRRPAQDAALSPGGGAIAACDGGW